MPGPIPARKHGRKIRVCAAKRRRYGAGLAMKGGAILATIFPTTPIFLTSDSSFNDYRPTMDPSGTMVIFERTPTRDDGGPTTLQVMEVSNPNPSPFLSGSAPASQTRPDWCWATGKSNVLFNGASSNNSKKSPVSVYMVAVVGSGGANPTLISGTTGAYYPKWNLEGTLFVTENDGGTPSPCNTVFTLGGVPQTANIDGVDMNNVSMFGGMPAVMSTDLPQIAYAGQPKLANWNGPNTPIEYSENYNYIFLNTPNGTSFVSSPLESDASISSFDPQYEGRAPDISPDGTMIVFESNRPNGAANYSIYLYSLKNKSVTQVTVSTLNCQHAKFFPCGTKLILGAQNPTWNIGWVDISSLL